MLVARAFARRAIWVEAPGTSMRPVRLAFR
jgi:hypothetical protein